MTFHSHRPFTVMALCLALCAPLLANAATDDRKKLTDKIMATGPLRCGEDAMTLFNYQLRQNLPDQVLSGMRDARKIGAGWRPGNENYDRVRVIVSEALAEDEAKNGPLFGLSLNRGMREVTLRWSLADLRYFATFFAKPEGRLYWNGIIEGASCLSKLKIINGGPPFAPLQGEQKTHWEASMAALNGAEERFYTQLHALTKDQQANLDKAAKRLGGDLTDAPLKLAAADDGGFGKRVENALKPRLREMAAIYGSYKPM